MQPDIADMSKIEIEVPKDMEQAFDRPFAGENAASVVWQLIKDEIEKRNPAADREVERSRLFEAARGGVRMLRSSKPFHSDEAIRGARVAGRP